ncbi:JOHN family subclass B1 metallo-beta-lactamase [Chitinophaga caeni]|uniref:beta-lactamase n=1 Tax=Chitinophaga caeni TaxID=2029983 RepID=A0A291QX78_9BACT|nr:subclass B1 metallo-beta-lactamase [Chitinophaga caeni]ATL48482.1 JOHN family subclass B1 metallo-beta-lactamase [Chitinophaga caeni]
MKHICRICLMILFVSQHAAAQKHDKLIIKQIIPNVFEYTTFHEYEGAQVSSNGMYVVTSLGAVLLDTPWDTTQFQPLLDSIWMKHQQRATYCIATHYHDDCTAGFNYYASKGIKTYSSQQTYEACIKFGKPAANYRFSKDTTFKIGEFTFKTFYPGAGHTADNIVVYVDEARTLFGGCFVKSIEADGLGYTGEAHISEWKESIRRVKKKFKNMYFLIPGHDGGTSPTALNHTVYLIDQHQQKK